MLSVAAGIASAIGVGYLGLKVLLLSVAAGIACAIGVGYLGLKVLFH